MLLLRPRTRRSFRIRLLCAKRSAADGGVLCRARPTVAHSAGTANPRKIGVFISRMRVLVAGRNAKILAKAAGTFAVDLEIHAAATKAACFALLERAKFDLIVACETLSDGSGLEVLSHVAVNTPN